MKKQKLCCLCQRWASGGIESFLFNLLTELPREEMELHLVAERLEESVFTETLRQRGVVFHSLSGDLRRMGKNGGMFRRLLRQEAFDGVYLGLYQGLSLRYAALAKKEGVPLRIAHSHNSSLRKSLLRPGKLLLHRLGRSLYGEAATHFWACSREAGEFLFGTRECELVANGIDTERFRFDPLCRKALREKWGWEDAFVLGNVGRLCPQKNQMFLLEVLARLLPLRPESRLILVGEGEDKRQLENRAEALGLGDKVLFYGASNHVEQLLSAMDVCLLPSLFEGLPIAGVEAQASGLPLLCSQGISRELKLTESVNFLPPDEEAWAKTLARIKIPGEERGRLAEAVAEKGFDSRQTAARLRQVMLGEDP